jgi:hypothetical protein
MGRNKISKAKYPPYELREDGSVDKHTDISRRAKGRWKRRGPYKRKMKTGGTGAGEVQPAADGPSWSSAGPEGSNEASSSSEDDEESDYHDYGDVPFILPHLPSDSDDADCEDDDDVSLFEGGKGAFNCVIKKSQGKASSKLFFQVLHKFFFLHTWPEQGGCFKLWRKSQGKA